MAVYSNEYQEPQVELEKLKKKIRDSHDYFKKNIDRYHKCKRVVFQTSINDADKAVVAQLNKPLIECNVLESYVSRLRGEFAKQTPSIMVRPISDKSGDEAMQEVIESHMRSILFDANNESFENEIWKDTLGGGWSVMKVWTEYESENSFNQIIKIGRCFDPTLCGFDPIAKLSHKGDGNYCFETFPMHKEDCEEAFGIDLSSVNFIREIDQYSWFYETANCPVVLVAHFYQKKRKKVKMVYLADNRQMTRSEYNKMINEWVDITAPPAVVKERITEHVTICRYTLLGDRILDYVETDLKFLPLIFVDGNSVMLRDTEDSGAYQFTRPYIYHAMDAQRIKNFCAQTFLNEVENLVQHKFMMPIDALPHKSEQSEPWFDHQKAATLLYNQRDAQGRDIAPPQPVQRIPIPPEVYNAFMGADETIRNILSTFDTQLGVNQSQLSGVAIVEGATQSNAVAMPFIMNYMAALTQAAKIMLDLIPKYYVTPRTIPVTDNEGKKAYKMINAPGTVNLQYDATSLDVTVEAGVNFEVQKQRSLETMGKMAQAFPAFAQMVNEMGLPVLVDNLDIRGADRLKKMAEDWQQQKEQAAQQGAQQPNPEMIKAQQQAQKAQMDAQAAAQKNQLEAQKAQMQHTIDMLNLKLQQDELQIKKMEVLLAEGNAQRQNQVQELKAAAEIQRSNAELALSHHDQQHRHTMDIASHLHQQSQGAQ